jgi:prevent-host-death family protein
MTKIGVDEAKTRLLELLDKVREGDAFTITRHGQPVAELRPIGQRSAAERLALVERMKDFQRAHALGDQQLRNWIEAGRR